MPGTPDFDSLYRADPDPFAVGSSWYERRKIDVALACLTRPEYELGWDAAAGTGHLALELSARCHRVLATDASAVAIDTLTRRSEPAGDLAVPGRATGGAAEGRTGGEGMPPLPAHVAVARSALPEVPQEARAADLVVISEVLYYLPASERLATLDMLSGLDAEVVTVHWRHHPDDTHLSGAEATREVDRALCRAGFTRAVWHQDTDFVLSIHRPGTVAAVGTP